MVPRWIRLVQFDTHVSLIYKDDSVDRINGAKLPDAVCWFLDKLNKSDVIGMFSEFQGSVTIFYWS